MEKIEIQNTVAQNRITKFEKIRKRYRKRIEVLEHYIEIVNRTIDTKEYENDPKLSLSNLELEIINADYIIRLLRKLIFTDFQNLSLNQFIRENLNMKDDHFRDIIYNGTNLNDLDKHKIILFLYNHKNHKEKI